MGHYEFDWKIISGEAEHCEKMLNQWKEQGCSFAVHHMFALPGTSVKAPQVILLIYRSSLVDEEKIGD